MNGVSGPAVHQLSRPTKARANALRAGFHLTAQRALPRPVGSRDRAPRQSHFKAAALRHVAGLLGIGHERCGLGRTGSRSTLVERPG